MKTAEEWVPSVAMLMAAAQAVDESLLVETMVNAIRAIQSDALEAALTSALRADVIGEDGVRAIRDLIPTAPGTPPPGDLIPPGTPRPPKP